VLGEIFIVRPLDEKNSGPIVITRPLSILGSCEMFLEHLDYILDFFFDAPAPAKTEYADREIVLDSVPVYPIVIEKTPAGIFL